ncbi:heavy-metal-associated domain-containing protein [Halopseudomonas pertucinogena]|uniref:HMA domain-containing protein n=1 Tax=Halopseudomonas pertucinogena TaxID=86175 RepID=A0ABQ2CP49_9GAMM|nr:heavy metal-associated domain-containing protein [Halopseudomonas pertucinogena]GGI96766.1 hypothetical protein GCM10009083_11780 [Halopseudomonas pertucinogena]
MSSIQLNVKEMTCGNCVTHVTDALRAVAGVKEVHVDLEKGKVSVKGDAESPALVAALNEAGYPSTVAHDGKATCCGGCH